jgi:hypothetical protein
MYVQQAKRLRCVVFSAVTCLPLSYHLHDLIYGNDFGKKKLYRKWNALLDF